MGAEEKLPASWQGRGLHSLFIVAENAKFRLYRCQEVVGLHGKLEDVQRRRRNVHPTAPPGVAWAGANVWGHLWRSGYRFIIQTSHHA